MASIKGISIKNYTYKEINNQINYSASIYCESFPIGNIRYASKQPFESVFVQSSFLQDFYSRVDSYFLSTPSVLETPEVFIEDLITLSQLESLYKCHIHECNSLWLVETIFTNTMTPIYHWDTHVLGNRVFLRDSEFETEQLLSLINPSACRVYQCVDDFNIY